MSATTWNSHPAAGESARLRHVLLLVVVALVLVLPGLGHSVMNREQELRVVLTARDMVEGGSWLIPHYLGEPRLRKPPLMYWLVAAAMETAGTVRSAFVARLPSALAAAAFGVAFYLAATRLLGRRTALVGSLVALSSFIMLKQARHAETDLLLSFFTATATLLGLLALRGRPSGWLWPLAGVCAGLGFLTKGPAALVLPILTWIAGAVALRTQARRPTVRDVVLVIGLAAAIALPWYLWLFSNPSAQAVAEAQLESEIARTATGSHHPGPIYFYVYTLLHAMLPWSILLPFALWAAIRASRNDLDVRLATVWFAVSFVALSVTGSKQIHYCTLLVPPAAWLVGWFIVQAEQNPIAARIRDVTLFALLTLLALGGPVLLLAAFRELQAVTSVQVALAVIPPVVATLALLRRSPLRRVVAICLSLGALAGLYTMTLESRHERYAVIRETLADHEARIAGSPDLHVVGRNRGMVEFYTGRPTRHHRDFASAWSVAHPEDLVIASEFTKSIPSLGTPPVEPIDARERRGVSIRVFEKEVSP